MDRQHFALRRQPRHQLNLICQLGIVVINKMVVLVDNRLANILVNCLPIEPCESKAEVPEPVVFPSTGFYDVRIV